jgi:capsular exopolysaccharide synthesis family protein
MLGVVFVLVIDNLEDTVVNLSDIEGRLALKVLAVLPHVNRKKREQVAKYLIENKYSHFSETVAGLRNLLDSPRYEAVSRCVLVISSQPGEGKTITSTSLAIAYAQTGRRVLHVDFDLRRPRIAKIWEVELAKERSFSHFLQTSVGKKVDFSTLVNKTKIEGLDIICSLPPDGVTPATIFGSSVVSEFFAWARENYDRIIVDAPPFGVVGDVISLAVLADSTIIMCCPDRTHFKPIQYCSRSLTEAGANILGVVVNDVEIANSSAFDLGTHRRYGYKHGYGYAYGYGYGYGRTSKNDEDVGDGDNPDVEHSADGSDSGPEAESRSAHDEFADED